MGANLVSATSRIAITRVLAVTWFAVLGVSFSQWGKVAPLFEITLSFVGWVLIAWGVVGRIWCATHIGGNKTKRLTTVGPYSICRNPLYFFSFVGGMGVMLVTETLILPLLFAIVFLAYYSGVILREEQILHGIHGEAFQTYCAQVPRFWPRFGLLSEPGDYAISTRHFRQSRNEVIWFIIAGGGVEFIEGLHESGFLPMCIPMY
jgi:protein-S-isoprenylcysteine O-methyltransferase Ste14